MKILILFPLLVLLVLTCSFGKMKNGYDAGLDDCKKSLKALRALLSHGDLTNPERRRIEININRTTDYILYHRLTARLISQLQIVSPSIYDQMDTLKDRNGTITDVYIKLVRAPRALLDMMGVSFFGRREEDVNTNITSEYGVHSVAIEICLEANALKVLCHELGHAFYIVPNLDAYAIFYRQHYATSRTHSRTIGHMPGDRGGIMAYGFEMRHRKDYSNYLQAGGAPLESMPAMLTRYRRENKSLHAIARAGS